MADATDEKVMEDAGVADCDSVVISIVGNIETSILSTLIVKELGVKNVIVKYSSRWHSKVVAKLGVDTVVYPEFEMAKKLVDNIGLIRESSNQMGEAREMYSKALAVKPDYKIVRVRLNKLIGIKS